MSNFLDAYGDRRHQRTGGCFSLADGSRSFDDPQSITAIYKEHSNYVWRVLRHLGVPDDDLDDAVQETFLVVFRRLPSFEKRAAVRTWLYAVAMRVASTRGRSRRREARRRELAGAQMHGGATVDPEDALGKAQAADLVDTLLDQLDPAKRTVFVLAEIEGVKVREISRLLSVNPRTVQSRLRLARERFSVALRRMQAREHNNRRVARVQPRALLDRAAKARPPVARRKAVAGVLAANLGDGVMPTLPGWASLVPVATTKMTTATVVGALALGVAGLGAVAVSSSPSSDPPTVGSPAAANTPQVATSPTDHAAPAEPPSVAPEVEPPPFRLAAVPVPPKPAENKAAVPPRAPPEAATENPAATLKRETELLEVMRAALGRGDAAAALASADRYLAQFPQGVLRDEARSSRLRALCAAGRVADARAYAQVLAPGDTPSRWDAVVDAACPPR